MKYQTYFEVVDANFKPVQYIDTSQPDMLGGTASGYWEGVGDSLLYQFGPVIWQMRNGRSFEVDETFRPEDHIDFTNEEDTHKLLDADQWNILTI